MPAVKKWNVKPSLWSIFIKQFPLSLAFEGTSFKGSGAISPPLGCRHVFKYTVERGASAVKQRNGRPLVPCRLAAIQGYSWRVSHHPPLSDTLQSDKCKLWHLGKHWENNYCCAVNMRASLPNSTGGQAALQARCPLHSCIVSAALDTLCYFFSTNPLSSNILIILQQEMLPRVEL